MRVIVAGSREFTDYALLKKELNRLTKKLDKKKLIVLSGGAEGADKLGEKWCFENMVTYERYLPDYEEHGRKAPLIRNTEMVNNADALIAFHLRNSPGTADVISKARKKGLKVKVIRIESQEKKWWEK